MSKLGNYMYPGMTQTQIDFYTSYIEELSYLDYKNLKRKAIQYYKEWNRFLIHGMPKADYQRLMIRYLHSQQKPKEA